MVLYWYSIYIYDCNIFDNYIEMTTIDTSNAVMSTIELNLGIEATTIEMSKLGELDNGLKVDTDYDAIANLNIPLSHIHTTFQFSMSDNNNKLLDMSNNNIHFFVVDKCLPQYWCVGSGAVLDPTHVIGTSDKNGVDFDEQSIRTDYVRYLAKDLFTTYLATDLFSNEAELIECVDWIVDNAWSTTIFDFIRKYAVDSTITYDTMITDVFNNGYKCLDRYSGAKNNLCGNLFKQLSSNRPGRFNVSNNLIRESPLMQPLPLMVGDSITFKIIIKAFDKQHNVVRVSPVVPDRKYLVKINMIDTDNKYSNATLEYNRAYNAVVKYNAAFLAWEENCSTLQPQSPQPSCEYDMDTVRNKYMDSLELTDSKIKPVSVPSIQTTTTTTTTNPVRSDREKLETSSMNDSIQYMKYILYQNINRDFHVQKPKVETVKTSNVET